MIVKTKKTQLPRNKYIKLGLLNILKEQWWIVLLIASISIATFFLKSFWFLLLSSIGVVLFFIFWVIQFYGVTMMDQSKIIFEKISYEISGKQIMIYLNSKQGMPLEWSQIKKAYKSKDYFLLVVSKAHLIYLPYKIFNNENSIRFVEGILKRKKLIK